jgi:hypothetical protein
MLSAKWGMRTGIWISVVRALLWPSLRDSYARVLGTVGDRFGDVRIGVTSGGRRGHFRFLLFDPKAVLQGRTMHIS